MEIVTQVSVSFNDEKNAPSDEYLVRLIDSRNNKTVLKKHFSEFIHLAKVVNKDIPQAKIEFPARGPKAFFQKLSAKKFQTSRTGSLDKMMKSIVQSELISSHPEVKKFIAEGRSGLTSSSTLNSISSRVPSEISNGVVSQDGTDIPLGSTEEHNLKPGDFTYIMQIGKGSFGRVYLATRNGQSESKYYAIKTLDKKKILQKNETMHITCERKVLIDNLRHPFLVSLKYSFQTVDKLYFVLDYVNGEAGELFFHLQRDRTFPEPRAKFYAAEIGSAIGYMHERHLIYRDLKPENILLGSDGHIRLTDFGLCKENMKAKTTTETFCGTPEYLAPEVLQKMPYTRSIDWWCLGAVTYEMVYGLPPFYSRNTDEMYQGILYKPLKLNSSISSEMRDFLTGMLQKNAKQRLGYSEEDWSQVKAHRFFRDINFDLLLAKKIRPAFIPNVSGPMDGRYIEAVFRNSPIPPSVDQSCTGKIGSDNPFEGFTFQQSVPLSFSLRDHRNQNLENFTDFH